MICDSCTTCPHAPLLPLPLCCPLSSSGRRCGGVGRLPPSPGVCETLAPRASGWPPSSTRSSIADRWRWRRRTVQTCRRSEFPGTHRRAGRPARMASLPPTTWGGTYSHLTSLISAGLYWVAVLSGLNGKGWTNEPQGAARWRAENSAHPTVHLSLAFPTAQQWEIVALSECHSGTTSAPFAHQLCKWESGVPLLLHFILWCFLLSGYLCRISALVILPTCLCCANWNISRVNYRPP